MFRRLFVAALCCIAFAAHALTTAQLQTLKAAINAETDTAFVAARTAGNDDGMAAFYNAPASPAFVVWRTSVSKGEIIASPAFDWTRVDNLSVGKARIWSEMFSVGGTINPSQANIQAGIDATWVGTAPDLAVRAGIYVVCKRSATRGEKLFATGTGSTAVPAIIGVDGTITAQNVSDARAQP